MSCQILDDFASMEATVSNFEMSLPTSLIGYRVSFRVYGLGFRVCGRGFWGLGLRAFYSFTGSGRNPGPLSLYKHSSCNVRVVGLGFRVEGSGLMVEFSGMRFGLQTLNPIP